jgi:ribosomal protein S18 acetylase RimI-like enzyme
MTEKVREATTADVDAAVETLTRAFEDYPMTRAGLDPDDYLTRLSEYNRRFLTGIGLAHGRVWVTDDVTAVAIWMTPATPPDAFAKHAEAFNELAGSRASIAAEYGQAMGIFRPRVPLWLLAILGVDPDHQRRGLGRAVVAAGLAAADREHFPAFLETQDPANITFYESLGFTVTAELELPHNGPMHYAMYRPPAP